MIGQTISHYKILEKLGEGGMGVVYKAQDAKLKRTVALKFLPLELTREEEAKKRFVHEAQAASALQHNNICTIHEIGETDDGQMFICMDCYEGGTLKDRIAHGPLKVEEAIDLVMQVAEGLAEAHSQEILHRDIKPANIMVTRKGVVKVVDFGVAKLPGRTKLTKTGSTVGTASYTSPEQARGEELDARSDIFSLGAVLYELVTGQVPFPGERETVVLYKILHEEPEPVSKHRHDVAEGVQRIIDRALKKDVEARYQSVFDMHNELKRLRQELTPSKLTGGAAQTGRPGSRIRRVGAVSLTAAIVVAAVAGIALVRQWQQRRGSPIGALSVPVGTAPEEELFRVAVAPFFGQSEAALEEGRVMQALVERRLVEELGGEKDVRIAGKMDISKPPRSHAEARTMGESLEATMVLWGEVLLLRGEVDIQSYMTMIRSIRNTKDPSAGALQTRLDEPGQLKLRKAKAAEIGDMALLVAGAYYGKKDPDKALFLLRKISPPTQESLRRQGNVFFDQQNWDLARDYYEKAIELDPTDIAPRNNLGTVYEAQGRYEEAIAAYNKAIELDPTSNYPHHNLGVVYLAQGRYEEAIAAYNKAIELDPTDADPNVNLGVVYQTQGRYEEAIAAYKKALALDSTDTYVHLWYFLLLHRAGAREQAHAHIVELSKTLAGDGWINPVVLFYAGESTEKEVLQAAASENPQQDRELKCEAYYYVGMAHLLGVSTHSQPTGADTVKAMERLEECTATNVESFQEYQWAESELQRLNQP